MYTHTSTCTKLNTKDLWNTLVAKGRKKKSGGWMRIKEEEEHSVINRGEDRGGELRVTAETKDVWGKKPGE